MQLYSISDKEFEEWIDSSPNEDELREALFIIEAKKSALWHPGHHDSYHRDRFERDAVYLNRALKIKAALTSLWVKTGQVRVGEWENVNLGYTSD